MKKLLRKFLGIVDQEFIIQDQERRINDFEYRLAKLESDMSNIKKLVHIGADVGFHDDESWAVICLRGRRQDYVNFLRLDDSDIRMLQNLLRQYSPRQGILDLPHGMSKEWFLHESS